MARYVVDGHVYHALGFAPPNTAVSGARVTIYDRDVMGGDDVIFSAETDGTGHFAGMTSDSSAWLEGPFDLARLEAVVVQGNNVQSFPCALAGSNIALPPMLVLWGPGAPPQIACNLPPPVAELRQIQVKAKRGLYRWAYDLDPSIANCADPIPADEMNPPRFVREYNKVLLKGEKMRREVTGPEWLADPFDDLDDYRKFFPPFRRPAALARYPNERDVVISDDDFADQRLAGANPLMLNRVRKHDDIATGFGGGFEALRQRLSFVDLQRLLDEKRLFLCDYGILGATPEVTGRQYMPTPFALFGVGDKLAPLAIQIEREFHGTRNPVFTPKDGDRKMWDIAKIMVQVADFCVHEMKYHLYECHLAMEPFAVAAKRNLAPTHPISVLLAPHFQGMIAKNSQARNYLMASFGPVAKIISQTIDADKAVVRRAAARWRFDQAALPTFLEQRGLNELPEYPYRDDAMLVWGTIRNFVSDYLHHSYASDGEVADCDKELQDWLGEVRSDTAGKLKGVPEVRTIEALADVLTQIIFTCSAQHSAVNFAQYDYMAFVPNQPGGAYARPLPTAQGPGETDLKKILPGSKAAIEQTHLMWQLAVYRYDRLGWYYDTFHEPWATDVRKFGERLAEIDQTIRQRNESRRDSLKYEFLRPSNIINSISV